jgi:CHAT domain-containing protein
MVRTKLAALLIAGTMVAGVGIASAQETTALGNNLADEACVARIRDDVAEIAGVPRELRLLCNGKESGAVAHARIPSLPSGEARRAAALAAFDASRPGRLARGRLDCRPAQWIGDMVALPCRARSGGWPTLVLARENAGVLTVAEGPASLFPVLAAAAGQPVAGSRPQLVQQLQAVWGEPIVLASASDIDRLRSLLRDARVANGKGRYADAEGLFRQALEVHGRLFSENDTTAAEIMMDLALNVSNQGRGDEAAALFRRAEPIMQRSANAADRARLATYLGYEAANRGDYANAQAQARTAAMIWQQVADGIGGGADAFNSAPDTLRAAARGELAMALNLQALMALRQDDVTSAYAAASQALLIVNSTEGLPRWWRSDVLSTLGQVSVAQGRLSAAETYLRNALAQRHAISGESAATLRIRTLLGRAYQSEGMHTSAIIAYRDALKAARALPREAMVLTTEDLVPFAAAITDYAKTLDDAKARQGLYAEAFDAFQLVRSPVVDRTIAQASVRLSNANPDIAALLRQIQDQERAGDFARVKLAHEQSLPDGERSAEVEDSLKRDIDATAKRVTELRGTLNRRFPDFATLAEGRPLQLDELRARIGANEGVVSFLIGRNRSFVQLVRRDGVYIGQATGGEAELRDAVAAMRRALEIQGGSINEFDLARSHQLYRDLFAGIEPQLAGLDHLSFVPTGPLASLPFALLVTSAPTSDRYEAAAWLARRAAIAHAPSLQAFHMLRSSRPAARPDRPLLAFGDPTLAAPSRTAPTTAFAQLTGICREDAPMPAELLKALTSLPDTASEVRNVARVLNAEDNSLFLGARANETNLRAQDLSRYRVLYMATHGLLPGELKCQGEPGLVLTPPAAAARTRAEDGLLEASEVASLTLNADLVVLSACNTATGGSRFGGEALSGLSEAFFHAGARNMLISHWQVPSAATAELMSNLFAKLGPEMTAGSADALRAAQLGMIGKAQTAHPFFWAAFVVMGDGASSTPAESGAAE